MFELKRVCVVYGLWEKKGKKTDLVGMGVVAAFDCVCWV